MSTDIQTQKVCIACAKDVSTQKRTKDSEGNYYCSNCWATVATQGQQRDSEKDAVAAPSLVERCWDGTGAWIRALPGRTWNLVKSIGRREKQPIQWKEKTQSNSDGVEPDREQVDNRSGQELSEASTKDCPFCAEVINTKARKCRFCGEMLDGIGANPARREKEQVEVLSKATKEEQNAIRYRQIATGLIGIPICIMMFLWAKDCQKTMDQPSKPQPMPTITVIDAFTGEPDTSLNFTGWQLESFGYTLKGTMVWNGSDRISDISYVVKRRNTVVRREPLIVPGGALVEDEHVEVKLPLWEEAKAGMSVTIEVAH